MVVTPMSGISVLGFWLMDLAFSIIVFRIMWNALQSVRLAKKPSASGQNALAQAVFVAKLNLVTVVVSVSTTTGLYIAAMVLSALESSHQQSATAVAAIFISWLLDSLSNDVCAIVVGFGSSHSALEVVSTACNADVIGCPVSSVLPHVEVSVVGQVLAPISTSMARSWAATLQEVPLAVSNRSRTK